MINRLIPAAITIFWLVMTGALVRTEFFPKPVEPVPLQQVMDLVFQRETKLEKFGAFYRGQELGILEISASPPPNAATSRQPTIRKISLNGNLNLQSFGFNARLRMNPVWAEFDTDYHIKNFEIDAGIVSRHYEDFNVKLTGSGDTPRLRLEFTTFTKSVPRTVTAEGDAASLVTAMAQEFGFAQVGLINSALKMATTSPQNATGGMTPPVVSSYRSQLDVQGIRQPMYVIETRSGDHLWVKIWVSRIGEIVLIASSAELELRNVNMYPSATTLSDGLEQQQTGRLVLPPP